MPSEARTTELIDQHMMGTARTDINAATTDTGFTRTFKSKDMIFRLQLVANADVTIVTNAGGAVSKAAGVKIVDLPTCRYVPLASRIYGSVQATGSNTTGGEIGLGSVVASGAAAVLGGTATFEDILEGGNPALANMTADAAATAVITGDGSRSIIGSTSFAAAPDIYLNGATAFAGNGTLVLKKASVIDIWGIILKPT